MKNILRFLIVDDIPFNILSLKSMINVTIGSKYDVEIDECLNG